MLPKTASFAGALANTAAVMVGTATSTSQQTYTAGNFTAYAAGPNYPGRTVTVTTTAVASAYTTVSPIVVTGTAPGGAVITENLQLTAAGGGQTIVGLKAFASVTQIVVPAQALATGNMSFGVQDVVLTDPISKIRIGGAGALHIMNQDGTFDTIPALLASEEIQAIAPGKLMGDATTTATNITIFFTGSQQSFLF